MSDTAYRQKIEAIRTAGWPMDVSVRALYLPGRAANVLAMLDLRTVGDVINFGDDNLLAAHAFGPCSYEALKRAIIELRV